MNDDFEKTTKFINGVYDNLTYYDLYGTSVFLFFIITFIAILAFLCSRALLSKEEIASDWENQRCNPQNIPFAGYISKPHDKTAFEYTNENFQYCIQDVLLDITEKSLQPFNFMVDSLTSIFEKINDAIQKIREVLASIRNNIKKIVQDIMNRILNIVIPLQTMLISLADIFNKTQGVLTAGLYTALGTYYTLQALMGAILELIIKMLIALVIMIVGLWLVPFTQPMAATMTAVFLSISIPLAIIAIVMKKVLHIEASGIPKLRCFDENTIFKLNTGENMRIKDLKLGNKLIDDSVIISLIKVTSCDLKIYNLNGIIVSESHVIKYNNKWVMVKDHPNAILIENYNNPHLYCINTNKKVFELNENIYTDWDEVYDETLIKYNKLNVKQTGFNSLSKVKMMNGIEKNISDVLIGDILFNGNIVYGIVELIDLENKNNENKNNENKNNENKNKNKNNENKNNENKNNENKNKNNENKNNENKNNENKNNENKNNENKNNENKNKNNKNNENKNNENKNNEKLYNLLISGKYFIVNNSLTDDYNYIISSIL
jgi:hypothetical protein